MWCKRFWLFYNLFHERIPQYTETLQLVRVDYFNSNDKMLRLFFYAYCHNTTCCDGPFFQKSRLGLSHEITCTIFVYFKGHGRKIYECNPHCHVWQSALMWTKLSKDVRRLSSAHHVFCVREMLLINLSPSASEWSDGRRWQIKTDQTSQYVEPSRVWSTHKITHILWSKTTLCPFPFLPNECAPPQPIWQIHQGSITETLWGAAPPPPSRHW